MAVARWALLGLVASLAVYSLVGFTALHRIFAAGTEEAKQNYTCPMHPQYVADHPGDCPICGMTLVPVPKESSAPSGAPGARGTSTSTPAGTAKLPPGMAAIHLEQSRLQLIGVKTIEATTGSILSEIDSWATVAIDEESIARVHTRSSGWVKGLAVKRTGDHVKKGQVLFRLYSPDAFQAQQEYLLLLAASGQLASLGLPSSGLQKDAARMKLEILGVPPGLVAKLEKTGKPSKTIPVVAPVSGHVIKKAVYEGMFMAPSSEAFEIADLSSVWVTIQVHQDIASLVRPGDEVSFETDALAGETFLGTVDQVLPVLDAALRSRQVRVLIPNPDGKLAPGMYGMAHVRIAPVEGVLVPEDAVIAGGKTSYLFVDAGQGHFEPRIVETGLRWDGMVQILSGVTAGESVVASGNFLLDSESKLRAAAAGYGEIVEAP